MRREYEQKHFRRWIHVFINNNKMEKHQSHYTRRSFALLFAVHVDIFWILFIALRRCGHDIVNISVESLWLFGVRMENVKIIFNRDKQITDGNTSTWALE